MKVDKSRVEHVEDKLNDLQDAIQVYGRQMQHELTRPRDTVAKLAKFQVQRVEWLQDLGDQMEEIIRDMLDRVQNVDLADAGNFTGRPEDVSPHRPA